MDYIIPSVLFVILFAAVWAARVTRSRWTIPTAQPHAVPLLDDYTACAAAYDLPSDPLPWLRAPAAVPLYEKRGGRYVPATGDGPLFERTGGGKRVRYAAVA